MTHDGQGETLLAAILDQPDDDAVRLIYADWLEEGGQDGRAWLIRRKMAGPAFRRVAALDDGGKAGWVRLEPCFLSDAQVKAAFDAMGDYDWPDDTEVHFSCGFVESARCTLDAWRRHGPAIVRAHPVVRVELTDREPFHFRAAIPEQWGWRHSEVEVTDEPLLDRVWWDALAPEPPEGSAWKLYDSEEAAREDFGRVLLAWAKAPALAQVT